MFDKLRTQLNLYLTGDTVIMNINDNTDKARTIFLILNFLLVLIIAFIEYYGNQEQIKEWDFGLKLFSALTTVISFMLFMKQVYTADIVKKPELEKRLDGMRLNSFQELVTRAKQTGNLRNNKVGTFIS